ncbi:hypothetical protein ABZ023_34330 [Streptomyces sp. NPDC006367]|uniref:hypothetical protein n=1 Tax=unclassified Streptomyces TaxID=2593676 RepID=UPI0033B022EB
MPPLHLLVAPTSLRFSLVAATAQEAEARAAQLENETHDLASFDKLGVRIEGLSFGDHSDTELAECSTAGSAGA